jgi:hypothetical protein
MNNWQFEDLLDEQSRRLPAREPADQTLNKLPDALNKLPDALSLLALLDLARDIADLLAPVHLRPAFRAELRASLEVAARQQQAQRALFLVPAGGRLVVGLVPAEWVDRVNGWAETAGREMSEISEGDRRWVVGAAAALSLAGILAYVVHQRGRPAA